MGTSSGSRSFAGINVKQDFGYGISTKPSKAPQPPNGELKQSQASRALTLAGYFVSGCMACVYCEIPLRSFHLQFSALRIADTFVGLTHPSSLALPCISSTRTGIMRGSHSRNSHGAF